MKITKFGHCCMLIEQQGIRILTDPGIYSTQQNMVEHLDIILITHEHSDHLHIESLKTILQNNPKVKILTSSGAGKILEKEGVEFAVVGNGDKIEVLGVVIEGFGTEHAIMHSSIPPVQNTGYLIDHRLFYPGDAFTKPSVPVEILALPVSAPWMKLPEAIDFALLLRPKFCFPIHDAILKSPGSTHLIPPQVLEPVGVKFTVLELDKEYEF